MPTDTQIPVSQVQPVPADYRVPNTVELRLKAVNALFTDNSAGADWLPAVVLLSDAGQVIARAADQGVKVTAGDDAEVSFFPGAGLLGGSSTGGAGALAWCYLQGGVLTSDNVTAATWDFFGQDASGIFTLDVTKSILTIGAPGVYLHHYYAQWESDNVPTPAATNTFRVRPVYNPAGSALQEQVVNFEAVAGSHLPDTGAHLFWDPWGLNIVNVTGASMDVRIFARSRDAASYDGVPAMAIHRLNAAVADVAPAA